MHIPNREKCNWLRERIETPDMVEFTKQKKLHTLDRLAWSEMFESFLASKCVRPIKIPPVHGLP